MRRFCRPRGWALPAFLLLAAASPARDAPRQAPREAPLPRPPLAPPGCTERDAGAKAERLAALLQTLINTDPTRARPLLDKFQATIDRYQQHQADRPATCDAFDALITRAQK